MTIPGVWWILETIMSGKKGPNKKAIMVNEKEDGNYIFRTGAILLKTWNCHSSLISGQNLMKFVSRVNIWSSTNFLHIKAYFWICPFKCHFYMGWLKQIQDKYLWTHFLEISGCYLFPGGHSFPTVYGTWMDSSGVLFNDKVAVIMIDIHPLAMSSRSTMCIELDLN